MVPKSTISYKGYSICSIRSSIGPSIHTFVRLSPSIDWKILRWSGEGFNRVRRRPRFHDCASAALCMATFPVGRIFTAHYVFVPTLLVILPFFSDSLPRRLNATVTDAAFAAAAAALGNISFLIIFLQF